MTLSWILTMTQSHLCTSFSIPDSRELTRKYGLEILKKPGWNTQPRPTSPIPEEILTKMLPDDVLLSSVERRAPGKEMSVRKYPRRECRARQASALLVDIR